MSTFTNQIAIDRLRQTIVLKLRMGRRSLKKSSIEGQVILEAIYLNSLGRDIDILGKLKGKDSWMDSNI